MATLAEQLQKLKEKGEFSSLPSKKEETEQALVSALGPQVLEPTSALNTAPSPIPASPYINPKQNAMDSQVDAALGKMPLMPEGKAESLPSLGLSPTSSSMPPLPGDEESLDLPSTPPSPMPSMPSKAQSIPNLELAKSLQALAAPQNNIEKVLSEANDRARNATIIAALGKGAIGVGDALGRIKTDTSGLDTIMKEAQGIPESALKQYQEKELLSPTSATSVAARKNISNLLHIKIPENMSASQLKEAFPLLGHYVTAKAKEGENALNREIRLDTRSARDAQNLGKALDADMQGSGRSAIGRAGNIIRSADAIHALLDQYKDDYNKMPPQMVSEMAIAINTMLSGTSAGNVKTYNDLIPKSIQGDKAKIEQYVLNHPVGAQLADFIKNNENLIDREKLAALKTHQNYVKGKIADFAQLKKDHPEEFSAQLKSRGINPEDFSSDRVKEMEDKLKVNKSPVLSNEKNDAFAKQHGLDPALAAQIIKNRANGQ